MAGEWKHAIAAGHQHALVYILANYIASLEVTDMRDKLYGILGIIQGSTDLTHSSLTPDYRKSSTEVFVGLARYLIEGTNCLSTLYAVDGIDGDLPSWVPSWTEVRHPIYLLNGTTKIQPPGPDPEISIFADNILHIRGIEIDRIHTVGSKCSVKNLIVRISAPSLIPLCQNWEREILGSGLIKETGKAFHDICREISLYGLPEREIDDNFAFYDKLLRFSEPSNEIDYEDLDLQSFTGRALDNVNRQRPFVTSTGPVGRTYDGEVISEGDIVCYLQGGYSQVFLRPDGDNFVFLGSCILYGHNDTSVQAEMLNQDPCRSFDII